MQVDDALKEKLTFRWSDFQNLTQGLSGTGGVLRSQIEDFVVEELPIYLPQGKGSHTYAWIEKRSLTTRDLVVALLREGLKEQQIGVAGLKDKMAITRQWISVPNKFVASLEKLETLEGVTILERSRHKNKLGMGHLKGNRFTIQVRQAAGSFDQAKNILEILQHYGVPNYFGPQRFGNFGLNAVDGYKVLHSETTPGGHRLKGLFISSLQSLFFNHVLSRRIEMGLFDTVILGDWAKKHDTGGEFEVKTLEESQRAKRFEISSLLPLYGKRVKVAQSEAGVIEQKVLEYLQLSWVKFASRRGDRRLSRFLLSEVKLEPTDDGYILAFDLPKGAFATSILREIMKDTDSSA
jgi:tRNA pseudouridine13 synthase